LQSILEVSNAGVKIRWVEGEEKLSIVSIKEMV